MEATSDLLRPLKTKRLHFLCMATHPKAFAMDVQHVLSIVWQNMFVYAFPPIQLIPRILTHFQQFQCTTIVAQNVVVSNTVEFISSISNPINSSDGLVNSVQGSCESSRAREIRVIIFLFQSFRGLKY